MKRYITVTLAVFLVLGGTVLAAAEETMFYRSVDFNTIQSDGELTAPFFVNGGGTSELISTDRGKSLCFSVTNKQLRYVGIHLNTYQAELSQGFQIGFSTKDVGTGEWGHRFFLLSGYTSGGARKSLYLATFSKVNHRLNIAGTDTGLYRQNVWYDFVIRFVITDTEKYADITVTAPFVSGFSATERFDLSELATLTQFGLYSGVTSDPSSSVTLYDDIYIAAAKEPLRVTASSPQNGSESVLIGTALSVSFNHPLRPETVNGDRVKLYRDGATEDDAIVCLSGDRKTVLLHVPRGCALLPDSLYTISIDGVTDIFGNVLDNSEISFQTGQGAEFSGLGFYQNGQRLEEMTSGVISAETNVINAGEKLLLYLALYQKEDGRLVCSDKAMQEANGLLSASVTVPDHAEAYTLYAYLWSMEDGQKPIVRAARLY